MNLPMSLRFPPRAGALACLFLAASLSAQTALEQQQRAARELEKRLPKPNPEAAAGTVALNPARQERLQKLLPASWRKLSQREPFHLLVLGDPQPVRQEGGNSEPACAELLARQLASLFFYTGGVRQTGQTALGGPSIVLRDLSGGGALEASAILASSARQAPVDLVLLCTGEIEAESGLSPVRFTQAVASAVAAARELGAEVLLAASWPGVSAASEQALGRGRPHADALAELAVDMELPFADLGRLTGLLQLPDPEVAGDEARLFAEVEQLYRGFFHDTGRGFLARPSLHRRMATLLLDECLDGPPALPWQVESGSARLDAEASRLELECILHNPGRDVLELTTLPLPAGQWRPVAAQTRLSLAAGEHARLRFSYTRSTPTRLDEPLVRLPLLLHGAGRLENAVVRAHLRPVALVWGMETLFNQEQFVAPACTLSNTSDAAIAGRWKAEYAGQRLQGNYQLAPGASQALDLRLNITQAPPSAELVLTLEGDVRLTQRRRILVTPNLGLELARPLHAEPAELEGQASLQVQASKTSLSLIIDLAEASLLNDGGSGPAWRLDLNLDARSYGKRLEGGTTATLSASGGSVDGQARFSGIPPWAFGTGYSAGFEAGALQAGLTTRADGRRQFRLTLPRSYFYLHEWALENGNSQLGLDVRLLLQGGRAGFHLSPSRKAAEDADSLVVLELAKTATRRFTVSVD
jgi:hypothetical protein